MSTPLIMFLLFIAITLGITYWAARRSGGANAFFAAGRRITGWQNGIAVAGDWHVSACVISGNSWHHCVSRLRWIPVLLRAGWWPTLRCC